MGHLFLWANVGREKQMQVKHRRRASSAYRFSIFQSTNLACCFQRRADFERLR